MRHMRMLFAPIALSALLATGCEMGGVTHVLKTHVRPIALDSTRDALTTVPGDAPFAITQFEAQRATVAGGSASSDASATADGRADVSAAAADGGQAMATLQLGHAFTNRSEHQIAAQLSVTFDIECRTSATPPTGFPDARVTLELLARNRRTRAVRAVQSVDFTSQHGGGTKTRHESCALSLIFPPDDTYDVYLSGTANVVSKVGRSAECELALTNVEFSLKTQPAPLATVGDTDDG